MDTAKIKEQARAEKRTATLTVRLTPAEKAAFQSYCDINDYDSFRDLFIQLKRYSGDIDLEDEVVIYRGGTDRSTDIEEALSWTTSLDVAKFFSTRFDGEQFLFKAKVKKENILAYINSRNEYEVIVSFEDIYDVSQIN